MDKTLNLEEKLTLLSKKVFLLIERNSRLEKDNRALTYKIERLTQERAEQQIVINSLSSELKTRKLSGAFIESEGDKENAKKTIEKILREIDDCIALINK
ncbi:MAG: hypothetical protein R3Y50_09800 [Rikenellaceae bacterium]